MIPERISRRNINAVSINLARMLQDRFGNHTYFNDALTCYM